MDLRREIAAVRGGRRCWRCPEGLRRRVVAYAQQRHVSGWSWEMIARKLGVGNSALGRWVEREAQEGAGALVPVSVGGMCRASLGGEAGGLMLVTPAGYRLEGLDLLSAAKLLEKLG